MFEVLYQTNETTIQEEIEQFLNEWNAEQSYIETKTSGSTGKPKVIRLQKDHMKVSAQMTINYLNLPPGGISLLCLSPTSIAGKMMIVRSILNDMKLIVVEPSSNPLAGINEKIDFCAMVPLQVKTSLQKSPDKLKLLGTLIIGGAPINHELWNSILTNGVNAYQTFGMTETISHIAMRRLDHNVENYEVLPGVSISSDNGALRINAAHLGVHNLQTNDLIEIADPEHFKWLGRKDFVINSGGIKIHPEQIEMKLGGLNNQAFFSFGIGDPLLGEKHIICVEGSEFAGKDILSERLDKFEIPKEIYFFKKFYYTYTGKIDRITTIDHLKDAEKEVL